MDSVYEGEKRMSKMTLDEAIIHAKELSENQSVCNDCREEHKQLAGWLEELKEYISKKCETSAREMFEKLGYKRNVDIDAIAFTKEFESHYFRIIFDLLEKEILINDIF